MRCRIALCASDVFEKLTTRLFIIFWHEKTTEIAENTENDYNSVISVYSVVDMLSRIIFWWNTKILIF
jgi:hypothetical protein